MMDIDESMTLADVVDAHPQLAREFEKRGLDYCCGGRSTLGEACARIGLDATSTIAELAAATTVSIPAEWTTMTAEILVDHIETKHHRYLWDELPRLTALIAKIGTVHGMRHPELDVIATCFAEVRADLEPHMLKEERVLFPMIRELATSIGAPSFHCGTLRNPISVMMREHDAVGELLGRLRQLTGGYVPPADGCASYIACFSAMAEFEADTHLHIHKENNVLFPLVMKMEDAYSNQAGGPSPRSCGGAACRSMSSSSTPRSSPTCSGTTSRA
jgi:regulator of cell morphogenesis and NO signaling